MTFRECRLSLQLIAEERVGAPRYHAAAAERAIEDARAEAQAEALNPFERRPPDGVR